MHYHRFSIPLIIACLCLFLPFSGYAQQDTNSDDQKPTIIYTGTPKSYVIADIQIEGVKNYEDFALIGLSGLAVGQEIEVPGSQITEAINRYWKHGIFSNVKITAEKIEGNRIWLKITLAQRPRISEINYSEIGRAHV